MPRNKPTNRNTINNERKMNDKDLQHKFNCLLQDMKDILAVRPKYDHPNAIVARMEFKASEAIKKAERK